MLKVVPVRVIRGLRFLSLNFSCGILKNLSAGLKSLLWPKGVNAPVINVQYVIKASVASDLDNRGFGSHVIRT